MKNTYCFIEPHYLPSLAYFKLISDFDKVYIDVQSKFIKQTFRNRCKILMSNKVGQLIIPVKHNSLGSGLANVSIDYSENWNDIHWKSIKSAYGKTPYFEFYAPYFEKIYDNPPEKFIDFIMSHLGLCFKFLGWEKEIVLSDSQENEGVSVFRNLLHSKKSQFDFNSSVYHQAFGEEFIPNLSLIDLLFNVGPESSEVIRKSMFALPS